MSRRKKAKGPASEGLGFLEVGLTHKFMRLRYSRASTRDILLFGLLNLPSILMVIVFQILTRRRHALESLMLDPEETCLRRSIALELTQR